MLRGRDRECARLDELLDGAREGRSAALLLHGEAGIGKTSLLQYAADSSHGWRVVRASGVEAESELPFAGLQQLCSTIMDGMGALPAPQQDALAVALGLSAGPTADQFMVGLAVLGLLSSAATEANLLCLVDDVQWLDTTSVQVLTFVARRLQGESVVMLLAERTTGREHHGNLPQLVLEGLPDVAARELLATSIRGRLDERVLEQMLSESRGNPLALLELSRTSSPIRIAGGFAQPAEAPGRVEASFRERVERLSHTARQLLLIAAADPTGETTLLWRAAEVLEVPVDALESAEADGLITLGARIAFRHSLLRSAVYSLATPEERRRAHWALALATDPRHDPDRRAWHLAHAAVGPREDVAAELERCAGRAQARGGLAAAGAFLERAAELTPDPGLRAERSLAAARARQLAGAPEAALALLAAAAVGPLSASDSAHLQRLQGEVALDLRRGTEAVALLAAAALRLESFDLPLARDTYLEALRAASIAGRLGSGVSVVARAAKHCPPPDVPPRAVDLLLDGLSVRYTDGYAASVTPLRQALEALLDDDGSSGTDVRWPWQARRVAPELFEDEIWQRLSVRNVQNARDAGALAVLPLALNNLASVRMYEGRFDSAELLLEEAAAISEASGTAPILFGAVQMAAWRGDERRALRLIKANDQFSTTRGEGVGLSFGDNARAVLHISLGKYEQALAPAQSACERDELMLTTWTMPELVESAVRSGRPDLAQVALDQFSERCQASGTHLALGLEARCRALLAVDDEADSLYGEAVEHLAATLNRAALARAHLLHGEWLRRQTRRIDAREELRTAHSMFDEMGMAGFGERARRELLATGETARKRQAGTESQLTGQEAQIVELATAGMTNPEIGAQLFLSPRTVEWHLRKVFVKLGVKSRRELRQRGPTPPSPTSLREVGP